MVEIERSREIAATPEEIHARLADPASWTAWSPWNPTSHPGLEIVAEVPSGGPPERLSWRGGGLPAGSLRVTARPEGRGVWYDVELEDGRWTARGALHFEPTGDPARTRVLWSHRVEVRPDPFSRLRGLALDARLGPALERGLARLAQLCERG